MKTLKFQQPMLACLIFFAACGLGHAATHYIVALDNTTSSTQADRSNICQKSTWALVKKMQPNDSITLVNIDNVSFGSKHQLEHAIFAPKTFNPLHIAVAKQELNDKIKKALDAWLKTSSTATFAFDAIYWAGDRFKATPSTITKKLLVCSDGIEESSFLQMRPRIPSDALAIVKKAKKVHDGLKSVEVTWVGLGGGETTEHTQGVEALWRAYFDAAGATVKQMGRTGL